MPAATVQPSPPAVAKLRQPVAPLLQNSQHFGKPPFISPKPLPPLLSLGNNCDLNSVRHTCCPSFSKILNNSVNNPSQCQNPYSFNLAKNAITIRPGTIKALLCPCCGTLMSVSFAPEGDGFLVYCGGEPLHMSKFQEIAQPPPWWRNASGTPAPLRSTGVKTAVLRAMARLGCRSPDATRRVASGAAP